MATEIKIIELLISRYSNNLYTFCLRLTKSKTDAEDLYQQTFLRLLSMPTNIDLSNNPLGFLLSVSARIWKDNKKKFARRNRIAPILYDDISDLEICDNTNINQIIESNQTKSMVRNEIYKLNDKLRITILLYYMGGLKIEEIASYLNIPTGTVKSRLNQARKKLKIGLEGFYYDRQQ